MSPLDAACSDARSALLAELNSAGHWEGELSTSPLSTATAVMALLQIEASTPAVARPADAATTPSAPSGTSENSHRVLANRGLDWLVRHQNPNGGWGDTLQSHSNISTTMLAHATLTFAGRDWNRTEAVRRASAYIEQAGGVPALLARYGRDHTFSIPILTHCALAGLVDWKRVTALPFELACLPANFYKWVRLPVVSYALPALIAIGQVRHAKRKPWNPLIRLLRNACIPGSLRVLERIQPASGGYLEATPLTSFVTMSLAAMGRANHPVARLGAKFLEDSVGPDGSWPIDTNLATWVTTLAINALEGDLPDELRPGLRAWLLGQQWKQIHPYTNAAAGGWAWTDLTGGVPDADDTPGALLALVKLAGEKPDTEIDAALIAGAGWLLDLQNNDGGWPTFCKGWGLLPFDRSAPDLTAHSLRGLDYVDRRLQCQGDCAAINELSRRIATARRAALAYLARSQRPDGAWLPLWFGNQDVPDDENPTYGTAKVLMAYRDLGLCLGETRSAVERGMRWLMQAQNADGGFGAGSGTVSTLEETGLAMETLCSLPSELKIPKETIVNGIRWLERAVAAKSWQTPSPIGFYFAKLWYFEKLYPLIFCTGALRRAREWCQRNSPPLTG